MYLVLRTLYPVLILILLATLIRPGRVGGEDPGASAAPWAAVMNQRGELPSFLDSCFTPFEISKSLTQDQDLRKWFDIIAGQPQGIFETKTRLGKCGGIEGIVRLNSPWTEDSALRFALEDYNRLQIHLFHGDAGVTLVYHEDDLFRWAGYVTTRKSRGVTPLSWAITATDDGRNRRTSPKNHDHYELRCRNREVVLSRGDVVLLRVPLAGQPDDVIFQGKAAFHGLSLVRTRDSAADEAAAAAAREVTPAKQVWLQQLDPRAHLQTLSHGEVRLSVDEKPQKRSWAAVPLPRDSPGEFLFEVSDVAPGAGIYLGNGKDGPRYVLRYVLDRRSRQMCLMVRGDDDQDEHDFRGLTEYPLPAVAPHHWLKLVFGAGQIRWWISSDGAHWAEPGEPIRNIPPDVTHVGLHCVGRQAATLITLNRMEFRPLTDLAALANVELQRKAVAKIDSPSLGAWIADITESTSAATDTNEWRRACALRTLAAGCNRVLGNELVLLLMNDEFTGRLPLPQQLNALDEAALLLDLWDDQVTLQRFAKRFHDAGRAAWEKDGTPPFSSIRHALMTTSIATRQTFDVATDELLRTELVQLAYTSRWDPLRELTRELRFFQFQQKSPLFDWAESLGVRHRSAQSSTSQLMEKQKEEWRELLIEDLNKDVYNMIAQWRVELSGTGRDDAARLIASIDRPRQSGVAPHWRDNRLLVSLPTAVQCAVGRDELLRQTMGNQFRDVAPLRVRQAIQNGDAESVELASQQFAGTEAAAAAHLWLGDQALAAGLFVRAAAEYRRAEQGMSPGQKSQLTSRQRLATSIATGSAVPDPPLPPPVGTVAVGTTQMSADEFEKLVKELAERSAKVSARRVLDVGQNSRRVALPPPAEYQLQKRAAIDGPVGNDPNREFARDVARRQIDWVDRQLGIAVDANLMFVCNRFQVAAYDVQSKQRVWQSQPPPGQIQFAQESTFSVSRPLLTNDRVYARLLYNPGATLACLDRANGQFVWTATTPQNEEIVSDPFWMGNDLACLKLIRTEQLESMLRLVILDSLTGFSWREVDLLRLRDSWRKRRCCELAVVDDGAIIALGGVVLGVDTNGRVRWIRQQLVLPADEEPQWTTQFFQPPMVFDDRVIVTQPGVRVIDCLRRDTGELVWSNLSLDLERVIGICDRWLVCQESRGFVALDKDSGKEGWRLPMEGIMVGATSGANGDVVFAQRLPTDAARSRFQPRLVWLDAAKGIVRAVAPLADLTEADPRLGPLVVDQDRIWTFFGRGQNEATREVVELTPNGKAKPFVQIDLPDTWHRGPEVLLRDAAAKVVPQWKLLHGETGDQAGLIPEVHGEREALGLRFRNSGAIALGREVTLPAQSKPHLRIRFGNEPAHVWKMEVRFRGQVVWAQDINPNTYPQPWKDFDVDLTQIAGQQGWLTVRAGLPQGGDAPSFWKTLEIIF